MGDPAGPDRRDDRGGKRRHRHRPQEEQPGRQNLANGEADSDENPHEPRRHPSIVAVEVNLKRARQPADATRRLSAPRPGGLVGTIGRRAECIDRPSALQPA